MPKMNLVQFMVENYNTVILIMQKICDREFLKVKNVMNSSGKKSSQNDARLFLKGHWKKSGAV